jgi:hypothetical protein
MEGLIELSTQLGVPLTTASIKLTQFIIKPEQEKGLNLVLIYDTKYPVYKDHNGFFIYVNKVRCNNGDYVTFNGGVLTKDWVNINYEIQ